jgi:hypothetical protein
MCIWTDIGFPSNRGDVEWIGSENCSMFRDANDLTRNV